MTDKLRFYETLYLVRPDIGSDELGVIRDKIAGALKENSGQTIRDEKWDERALAYEIEGYRRGLYHILTYKALPGVVAAVEKHLGFHKSEVMRFITVSVDEDQAHGREPEKPPVPEQRLKEKTGEERQSRRADEAPRATEAPAAQSGAVSEPPTRSTENKGEEGK